MRKLTSDDKAALNAAFDARGPRAAKGSDQYMLRLPDGLRERVAARAARSGRSMNTEIIAAIVKYLDDDAVVDNLTRRVERLEASGSYLARDPGYAWRKEHGE